MDQQKKEVVVEKKYCCLCKFYNKKTKMCAVKNNYTARKKTCDNFERR